jgi:hypothetical protein
METAFLPADGAVIVLWRCHPHSVGVLSVWSLWTNAPLALFVGLPEGNGGVRYS